MFSSYSFLYLTQNFTLIFFVPFTTLLDRYFVIHIHNPMPEFVSPLNFYVSISISVCIRINLCRCEDEHKNVSDLFLTGLEDTKLKDCENFPVTK